MTTRQSTLTSRQQKAENAKARQAKKAEGQTHNSCGCGCGELTIRPDASYRPGHDARHLGRLLAEFDKGSVEAGALIIAKGWRTEGELVEREKRNEERATAKADREENARVNAEAKAMRKADTTTEQAAQTQPEPG